MNVRNMTNTMLKQKAQRFYSTLYQCTKVNPTRKFHALYDKIYRPDILKTDWLKVKANKGSADIDGVTIHQIVDIALMRISSKVLIISIMKSLSILYTLNCFKW